MELSEKLREAEEIFSKATEEYQAALEKRDWVRLRDACEKGWLTIVKLVDALLISRGYKPAESHRDRRDRLWEIQEKDEEVRKLGFYDRLGARSYWLHVQGFYEGSLDEKAVAVELAKVKEFIKDAKLAISSR